MPSSIIFPHQLSRFQSIFRSRFGVRSSELLSRAGLNDSPSRWMDPARSGHTDGSQAWTQDERFADLDGLCHSGVAGVTSGRHLHASQAITTSPTNSSAVNQ